MSPAASPRRLRSGFTLIETIITLAVVGLIVVPAAAIISQLVVLPGERSDTMALAHNARQAVRWISMDARQASGFSPGADPDYGTFTWTDRISAPVRTYTVRYYYDSGTGSLMREEDAGSGPAVSAIAGNIAAYSDVSMSAGGGIVSASITATAESTSGSVTRSSSIKAQMRPGAGTGGASPPPVTVAWDDFESAGWGGGWGWLSDWNYSGDASVVSSDSPYQGAYHIQLRRGTGHADRAVDLSGLGNVRLQFWARAGEFESGETAAVSVSPDGSTWFTVRTWIDGEDDNVYRFEDIDLSGYAMSSEFWIAFHASMSDTSDMFWADDIKVVRSW